MSAQRKPVLELVPEAGGSELPPPGERDPLIGTLVDLRYMVRDVIGRGGMGIVYDAVHQELERPIALKVLGPALASDEAAIERFQQEARTASNLGHPNIVTIHDFGRLPDRRPYIAMERLKGVALSDALANEVRLEPERALRILAEVAEALDAVHARGVVHRDIKPENIFLARRSGKTEVAQLLDFGLAAFALPGDEHVRVAGRGEIHGTPCYMAPEAVDPRIPADHRADIYSLAVVAFELLCGEVPFDDPNPVEVLKRKVVETAPSMFTVAGLSFPGAVEDVLAKSLYAHPEMRHESAGGLVRALAEAFEPKNAGAPALGDQTPTDPPPSLFEELDEPSLPVSPVFRGLRFAVVLLLLGGAVAAYFLLRGEGEPSAVASEGSAAGEGADEGEAEPTSASAEPPPRAAAAESEDAREPEDDTAEASPEPEAEEAAARPSPPSRRAARRARTSAAPAPAPEAAGEPEPAEPEPASAMDSESGLARARELTSEGTQALVQGRLRDAVTALREATALAPRHAPAWRSLGFAHERLHQRDAAVRAYERYLRLAPGARDAASVRTRLEGLRGG